METRQLEYFVAVAEELSFTRAAQRLYAVQSTVSAAIKSLEAEVGATLFDRSTRRVTLTPAGQAFLVEARAMLDAFARAVAAVQDTATGLRGSLRIGTMTGMNVFDLPAVLGVFHQRHPLVDIHVTVSTSGSTGLAEDLRHGRLDIALLGLPETDLTGFTTRPLARRPYLVLLPAEHPLAGRAEIDLHDLIDESFVDTPAGFGNRIVVDRAFERFGVRRRVSVEVDSLFAIPSYVRTGLGVAVTPELDLPETPGVISVPVAGTQLCWLMTVATAGNKEPNVVTRTLLDLIDAELDR
ncbi:LysR family transcriptional regulator [Actinocrispum sp. NPDC049592]|uniref:LysR family transcriptional regulator n=1 Tax=Actinocrispum sp. NPDC049592 TaxID=3154835 RepID=UPI00343A5CB9